MSQQDEQELANSFKIGYSIDRAYAEADRHRTGSDAWHYWMDEAKRLETELKKG